MWKDKLLSLGRRRKDKRKKREKYYTWNKEARSGAECMWKDEERVPSTYTCSRYRTNKMSQKVK
jgi:hypothetical protein